MKFQRIVTLVHTIDLNVDNGKVLAAIVNDKKGCRDDLTRVLTDITDAYNAGDLQLDGIRYREVGELFEAAKLKVDDHVRCGSQPGRGRVLKTKDIRVQVDWDDGKPPQWHYQGELSFADVPQVGDQLELAEGEST